MRSSQISNPPNESDGNAANLHETVYQVPTQFEKYQGKRFIHLETLTTEY